MQAWRYPQGPQDQGLLSIPPVDLWITATHQDFNVR